MNNRDYRFVPFQCISSEGLTIRGSYHGVAESNAPLVIFCHGFTGHRFGPGYIFVKLSRALEEAGVSSLRFDFTGSGESEGPFCQMSTASMLKDLTAVSKEAKNLFSPRKLILCGHSFGGMIAARSTGSLHANGVILLSPVGDPEGIARRRKAIIDAGPNNTGLYENGPHEMSLSFLDGLRGFDPATELAESFPDRLLLIQGDADLSITIDESNRYVTEVRKRSIPVEYHILKGSDHNYSRVSDVIAVISSVVSWIKEHFGE